MKSIEKAIFPLIFVLCMCGFFTFEYPQGRPRLYFSVFYILMSWLLYIYLVLQMRTFIDKFLFDSISIFYYIMNVVLMLTILNIYRHKKLKSCFKKLDIMSDTLEELGTSKNYIHLRAQMIWMIIGWIGSIIFVNSFDTLWLFTNGPKSYVTTYIYVPYLINYFTHITTLYVLTFIMLLRYIKSLFERVNQNIKKLIEQKKREVKLACLVCRSPSFMHRHLSDISKSNQLICLFMHMHFELSFIARELSTIFGLQVILLTTIFHLTTLQFIFLLYENFVLAKTTFTHVVVFNIFCIFLYCIRNFLELIVINYICEGICIKANQTEKFLNSLATLTFDVETQENITQFLLQILRRPLRITAFGFYHYGYKFVHTLISRAVKIVMIVIQAR